MELSVLASELGHKNTHRAGLCLLSYLYSPACSLYESLVMALSQGFTPVKIQLVQSGLFHSRRQKVNERVNDYAQDLNRLYQKAYPQTNQGSQEADTMGKAVLPY